jgi:hypothetical protein
MSASTSSLENLTLCSPRLSSGQDPHKPVLVKTLVPDELEANHVLIKVDRFGWSTNNMTYQALGDSPHFRLFFKLFSLIYILLTIFVIP